MIDVNHALDEIAAKAAAGELAFSTPGRVALRVQQMVDDPDCAVDRLAKLVASEPLLCARVLAVANSVTYNRGGKTSSDIKAAISRLGFAALRALAASVLVRQVADQAKRAEQRALASSLWQHTAHVAALARVIARRVTRQNPDHAFFAGIVHEVGGFYLIAQADAWPGLLEADLAAWSEGGEARVGRAVLQALEVPALIAEAIELHWAGYLASPTTSLGDTLLLANQLAPVESPLDARDGMSRKGMAVELEMLIDDESLSAILADAALEVASLTAALEA